MLVANSTLGPRYIHFWETEVGPAGLHLSIEEWVNDALMAIFFFLVGIEIKRELMVGQLADLRRSTLPVGAAIGGILLPAAIYIALNSGLETASGWAIPAATDIAFSLAVLSLLGTRVPMALKIFLTALAIIDDLGTIIIIALFYTKDLQANYLLAALLCALVLLALNVSKTKSLIGFFTVGLVLWYCVLQSGVHATLAGVVLALTIPPEFIEALEHRLHKPVNYVILPLFALANTAILLSGDALGYVISPLGLGIYLALVIGKPTGVLLTCFMLVRLKLAALPVGVNWKHLAGAACTAGIGFTISVFLTNLSFSDPALINVAKLAVIGGSVSAGVVGFIVLKSTGSDPATSFVLK